MKTLSIDIETKSSVDLGKAGVYRYAQSPDFDILLFGYSIDGEDVKVIDLACGEKLPEEIISALLDSKVTKTAFNATFERICLSYYLRKEHPALLPSSYLNPSSWKCSMVLSAYNGLPQSLEGVGAVLGFDKQKLSVGKDLVRYFCTPCKATKTNGGRTWNLPEHAPEKWQLFKSYNKRDVEVELQIQNRLANYPVPESVWDEYHMDQSINDRGIRIDSTLVQHAIEFDDKAGSAVLEEMKQITGLENPGSVIQLKGYLADNGFKLDSLGKKNVSAAIEEAPQSIAQVLQLRLQQAKSSVRKYQAMENSACMDDRCRGMFRFYGASRTGRWSGRIVQLQNLYRNDMPDLKQARELVRSGDYEMLVLLYPSIAQVLAELVRTAFIPSEGYKFIVSDFSAIEARVLSFLAGEQWRLDVFHNGGDIYCASASQMFKVSVEKHGQNAHLRQKGKQAELACGYGGSVGAMISMGALEMGLKEEELQDIVSSWREANPKIVEYWWKIDTAAKKAVSEHTKVKVGLVSFEYKSGMLFINLPSGRRLSYVKPRIGENRFGGESVQFYEICEGNKWGLSETYGGKLVENIVQAISRDILANAMKSLRDKRIVAHVHDELIIECPMDTKVGEICEIMGKSPQWMPGIELRADGYECMFYMKD